MQYMAVSYALVYASVVWFLPDVLVFCVRRLVELQAQAVILARGPQQAPGTQADLCLCAHCKHSRGAEGGSSPWTHKRTDTSQAGGWKENQLST